MRRVITMLVLGLCSIALIIGSSGSGGNVRTYDEVERVWSSPSTPKIQIKLGNSFEFLGETSKNESANYSSTYGGSRLNIDSYIFGEVKNNTIKKGLVLIITKAANGSFSSDDFSKWEK